MLDDILGLMCTSRFIEELFRPQPIYSAQSLRTIFYRLAHSSIMRLNKQSMDKVWSLRWDEQTSISVVLEQESRTTGPQHWEG